MGVIGRAKVDLATTAALITIALWALNIPVVKDALDGWGPMAFSFVRFGAGALLYAGWVLVREGSLRVRRRDLPQFAVAGLIGIAINQYAFMYGLERTTASTVTLLFATTPIWAALLARALGWERVRPAFWAAVALSVVGVLLVLVSTGAEFSVRQMEGVLFALGAPITWGMYSVLARPLLRTYSPAHVSAVMMLIGAPLIGLVGVPEALAQNWGAFSPGDWGAMAYALLGSLIVANVLWFVAIRRAGAARAVALMPLQPFLGVVFSFLLLGERLGWLGLAGGAVIIVGIAIAVRSVEPVAPLEAGLQE